MWGERLAGNITIKQSRIADSGWSSSLVKKTSPLKRYLKRVLFQLLVHFRGVERIKISADHIQFFRMIAYVTGARVMCLSSVLLRRLVTVAEENSIFSQVEILLRAWHWDGTRHRLACVIWYADVVGLQLRWPLLREVIRMNVSYRHPLIAASRTGSQPGT